MVDENNFIAFPVNYREKPISRGARRMYEHEENKAYELLIPIYNQFLEDLWNPELPVPYSFLYEYYLEKWIYACRWVNKNYSLCQCDEYYFSNFFKPQL